MITLLIAIVVAIQAIALGVLGYRRSQRIDAIAAQAGIATTSNDSIVSVIDGLNKLVANLQADNKVLRENIFEMNAKLTKIIGECDELKRQLDDLRRRFGPKEPATP